MGSALTHGDPKDPINTSKELCMMQLLVHAVFRYPKDGMSMVTTRTSPSFVRYGFYNLRDATKKSER